MLVVKRNLSMESDDKREQGDEKGKMVTSGLEIKNE